jgi:hypothetical protein
MHVLEVIFLSNSNQKPNVTKTFSPRHFDNIPWLDWRDWKNPRKTLLWLHNLWAEAPQKRKYRLIFPVFDWLGMKWRVTQVSRLFCPRARQLHRIDNRHPPAHNATAEVLRDARRWISWINILRYASRKLMFKPNYGRGWGGLLWARLRSVGFHKMQAISLLLEGLWGLSKMSKFLETVMGISI